MTAFAFKRTGDADYPKYLKILVQGPPKSGKTTFISTAPNVVVAACEAGLMTISHLDIPYIEVDSTDKLQSLEMILGNDSLRLAAAKKLGLDDIETMAVDTLDAWQDILKKEILAENRRTQMQQADWGTLKERMAAILKKFVALPVNVIFTVHTQTSQDEDARQIYAPALQGGIRDEIAGYVDFSLLSFRERQTGKDGVARINYYLKTEGDQKNPHLGNRASGRLPEIVAPDFQLLHDAVFKGQSERITIARSEANPEVIKELPDESDLPVAVAQSSSQPETEPESGTVVVEIPDAKPTGIPEDDPNGPINASGISMLTKQYAAEALVVPEDLKSWDLGKARTVAKWFMAINADKAAGNPTSREDLIEGLKGFEGFAGEMDGVQVGVDKTKKTPAKKTAAKVAAPVEPEISTVEPKEPQVSEQSPDDAAEEAAVEILQETLEAVVIGQGAVEGAKCADCDKPCDDPDIANLGVMKFKKPLCVQDYKRHVAETKQ